MGQPAEERLEIPDRPNLDVFLGHRGSVLRGDDGFAASMIANACLGQSTLTSRLGVAVRDEAGLTYGIYSRFFGTMHIAGPWATYLSVSAGHLDQAVGLCREVIADYTTNGPSEAELSDEKLAQAGSYRVGLATNGGVARELVSVLTAGQPVEHLDRYPERVLSLSRDEVMAAIRKHLHPDQIVVTAAGTFGKGQT
jgi:zinc protease